MDRQETRESSDSESFHSHSHSRPQPQPRRPYISLRQRREAEQREAEERERADQQERLRSRQNFRNSIKEFNRRLWKDVEATVIQVLEKRPCPHCEHTKKELAQKSEMNKKKNESPSLQ